MGKDHVPELIRSYLALDAEGVAAIAEAAPRVAGPGIDPSRPTSCNRIELRPHWARCWHRRATRWLAPAAPIRPRRRRSGVHAHVVEPHLTARDRATVIACLFGDAAARALGYSPQGLSNRAGFALALHDARLSAVSARLQQEPKLIADS